MHCLILASLIWAGVAGTGQALRVSDAKGVPGDKIVIEVSIAAQDEAPATLKWELIYPAQLLEIEGPGAQIGKAAEEAGKQLVCAPREAYRYVCVLTGGHKPLGNGVIALFPFKIRSDARAGDAIISVGKIDAVTKEAKTLQFKGSDGRIEIERHEH